MNVFQQTFRFVQDILRELERHNDWNARELKCILEQVRESRQDIDARLEALSEQVAQLLAEAIPNVTELAVTVDAPENQ